MKPSNTELRDELRQGSEARHIAKRLTPDGYEHVEMVPMEWAIEVVEAYARAEITRALQAIKLPEKKAVKDLFPDVEQKPTPEFAEAVTAKNSYNAALDATSEILERERRRYG